MKSLRYVSCVSFVLVCVAGCSPGKEAGKKPVPAQIAKTQPLPVGATGVPIDPTLKQVVVVNPSSGPASPQERMAVIRSEQSRSEARIAELMTGYTKSMDNERAKERTTAQLKKEMEVHKRQTLEMVKLGQLPAQQ